MGILSGTRSLAKKSLNVFGNAMLCMGVGLGEMGFGFAISREEPVDMNNLILQTSGLIVCGIAFKAASELI